jgi:hypothetical protein
MPMQQHIQQSHFWGLRRQFIAPFFVFFWQPVCASSLLTVLPGSVGEGVFQSSTFLHYGPRSDTVRGTGVFLDGKDLCKPSDSVKEDISGKIVLTRRENAHCNIGDSYKLFDDLGVRGLIFLVIYSPPGIVSSRFHTWDPRVYENRNMTMIDVPAKEIGESVINAWRDGAPCFLLIGEPHSREYENVHTSFTWVLLMRFLIPALAFATALHSKKEILRLRRVLSEFNNEDDNHKLRKATLKVSLTVCCIQAVCCFITGVMLVCGHLGPYMFKFELYLPGAALFSGFSLFTTALIALFMREEWRALERHEQRRSIWKQYRFAIIICAILGPGLEMLTTMLLVVNENVNLWQSQLFLFAFVVLIVFQIAVALYFFAQVRALGRPLKRFATLQASNGYRLLRSAQILARTSFWLTAGSLLMIANSGVIVIFVIVSATRYYKGSGGGGMFYRVAFCPSRVGIAYCQIMAITPMKPESRHWWSFVVTAMFRNHRITPVAEPPNVELLEVERLERSAERAPSFNSIHRVIYPSHVERRQTTRGLSN